MGDKIVVFRDIDTIEESELAEEVNLMMKGEAIEENKYEDERV